MISKDGMIALHEHYGDMPSGIKEYYVEFRDLYEVNDVLDLGVESVEDLEYYANVIETKSSILLERF